MSNTSQTDHFRLSRIVTRTGDKGETGLATGERLAKHHPRITAMGDVDELNSLIGLLRADLQVTSLPHLGSQVDGWLDRIQHDLFDLGGGLSMPRQCLLKTEQLGQLEAWIEGLNEGQPPLKEFVLPGGSRACAQAHVCRSVARRAERSLTALLATEPEDGETALLPQKYLNRLSDLLFVLARALQHDQGLPEVVWRGSKG